MVKSIMKPVMAVSLCRGHVCQRTSFYTLLYIGKEGGLC